MTNRLKRVLRFLAAVAILPLLLICGIAAFNFPYDVGPPSKSAALSESALYYQDVYTPGDQGADADYIEIAREAAHDSRIVQDIAWFTEHYGLEQARTLEVGAGSGALQDLTEDYTGLDIADSAARFFHKPFVQGSATALPFDDNEFDVIWTVWTLEHVPDPELALQEMRRVLRDDGYLYLRPAWNNPTWASAPYLGLPEDKIRPLDRVKLSISQALADSRAYGAIHLGGARLLRTLAEKVAAPTRLRYHEMTPNYATYAVTDADAINSIDCFEAALWFRSRGDEIRDYSMRDGWTGNCGGAIAIQIHKPTPQR